MKKYGFYDRLTEAFPSQIIVDVCEVCNYECTHCPQSIFKRGKGFSGAFLSEELNKKIVDEVATHGKNMTQQIRYTAKGEPFMHPSILSMLEYAVNYSGTFVSITTNGSLLDNDIMTRLLKMNLGLIDISLDALNDDTYSNIRRKGNLALVRDNVLLMLKLKEKLNASTRIIVSFIEQELNTLESDGFKKYWEDNGVDYVVIRKLHSAGGFMSKGPNETFGIIPCVYPWERIALNAKGKLDYCAQSWEGKTVIPGTYADTTVRDIWNGTEYSTLRKEHLCGEYYSFTFCQDCPDRQLTIWPAERDTVLRGYGDMITDFSNKEDKI